MVSLVIEEGLVARQKAQTSGQTAVRQYAVEVTVKAEKLIRVAQHQGQRSKERSRSGGVES
jgi:hypothetical protein